MDRSTIEGTLVALEERAYKPFTGADGRTVAGGVTRTAYVACSFDQPPVAVRVRDASDFVALSAAGFGAEVEIECDLAARNNRLERTLVQLHVGSRAAA